MMLDYPYLQILGNLVITFIAVLVSVNVLAMFLPLGNFFFHGSWCYYVEHDKLSLTVFTYWEVLIQKLWVHLGHML